MALQPGITINRILTVQNGSIRVIKDPVSGHLFYCTTDGRIYEVHQPSGSAAYDSLVYTSSNHHVTYVQGFIVHDSTFYVSGNDSSSTPLTFGIIERGVLQSNGTRVWSTVMQTDFYKTADYFDHLFSGIVVSPAGDSIVICSGARGDHGEIETRYGLYPGVRNEPITSNLYIVPTHDTAVVILHNNTAWNDTTINLYARGIRNTFDMAYDGQGRLFGVENSGDRDHNEEMNWLRKGHHYGFPWRMGDSENPQQYPSFNPATDLLIPHYSRTWRIGAWSNDPTFPPAPSGVVFSNPIQNFGPDADKYRDSLTGNIFDASDSGISIGTFTGHRSPLGLVFDNDSVMHPLYRGDAFMLSWTKGLDTCGCTSVPDTGIGPYVDPSQDLIHLDLAYDSLLDNFTLNATRIVADFAHPVDDDIDSNKIYVIENGYGGTSGLFEVVMPFIPPCTPSNSVAVTNSCDSAMSFAVATGSGSFPYIYEWRDSTGSLLQRDTLSSSSDTLQNLVPGNYMLMVTDSFACSSSLSFDIIAPVQLSLSVANSCDSAMSFAVANASGQSPFVYEWRDSTGAVILSDTLNASADTLHNISAGYYSVLVTDSIGCSISQSFAITTPFVLMIDSVTHTTCTGCADGSITFTANHVSNFTWNPAVGTINGSIISNLPSGFYAVCGEDSMNCLSCDTVTVIENPLSAFAYDLEKSISIYPNPSRGTVTISFYVEQPGKFSFNIFDLTGALKKEIANSYFRQGKNTLSFDVKDLVNGIFLLKVNSSEWELTKKLTVIR